MLACSIFPDEVKVMEPDRAGLCGALLLWEERRGCGLLGEIRERQFRGWEEVEISPSGESLTDR